jgi:hypothetical protein
MVSIVWHVSLIVLITLPLVSIAHTQLLNQKDLPSSNVAKDLEILSCKSLWLFPSTLFLCLITYQFDLIFVPIQLEP